MSYHRLIVTGNGLQPKGPWAEESCGGDPFTKGALYFQWDEPKANLWVLVYADSYMLLNILQGTCPRVAPQRKRQRRKWYPTLKFPTLMRLYW